jgi:excisionase family DNA binding protein
MDNRLLYRVQEAAHTLGVSRSKTYELIARNEIPSIKVGGSIRVPADALRAWITQQLAK